MTRDLHKALTVLMALLMVFAVAVAIAGCGDNVSLQANEYTVVYSIGEETDNAPTAGKYAAGATFILPDFDGICKTGYVFKGWNDGTTDYTAGATYTMPAYAVTFNAVWVKENETLPIEHTVTFYSGNSQETVLTEKVVDGNRATKPATDPVHPDGKLFCYWAKKDTDEEYDFTSAVVSDLELYAVYGWELTFTAGENAAGSVEPLWISEWNGAGIELPEGTGLTKSGFVFDGWTDGEKKYCAGETFFGSANHMFTAVWRDMNVKYTVTLVKSVDEAEAENVTGTVPVIPDKAAGERFGLVTDFALPHYGFTQWNIYRRNDDNTLTVLASTGKDEEMIMPAGDIIVAPAWVANYVTISFDANGGSGTMENAAERYHADYVLSETCAFTAPAEKMFKGWAVSADSDAVGESTVKLEEPAVSADDTITLYAVWEEVPKYTVRFFKSFDVAMDEFVQFTGAAFTLQKAEDEIFALPAEAFILEHYGFTKWEIRHLAADGEELGEVIKTVDRNAEIVMPAENIAIAPIWEKNFVTVSFHANGGSGVMDDVTEKLYGEEFTFPDCAFTAPEGKAFSGWSDAANGDVFLVSGVYLTEPLVNTGDTVTLYAIWEDIITPTKMFEGLEPTSGIFKIVIDTETNKITFYYTDEEKEAVCTVTAAVKKDAYVLRRSENPTHDWLYLQISSDGNTLKLYNSEDMGDLDLIATFTLTE